ncbi:alpha-mannosidase IC [Pyrenochaeta sp. DS3sAY3a]|nr:alpha-mannosidase IC [Pyrenochaeta sp. DS3sAY3a]
MHGRKGSFGYSPSRSRVGARWSGLSLVIFVVLILFYNSNGSLWILPIQQSPSASRLSCPTTPPFPPLRPSRSNRYDWGNLTQRYPVESFAQLPSYGAEKAPRIQYDFRSNKPKVADEVKRKRRQDAVKSAFERSSRAYKKHAWQKDELLPLSNGSKTSYGGWGATLVDSLDTLWIMDMKDEFNEAVEAIMEIDFSPKDMEVNMFETIIRYFGGLLAAYDMTDCKDMRLLDKAMELGDMIYASFDTPNRMPITRWNPMKAANHIPQEAAQQGILAELASFSLEFTRASQLTGDMKYYDAVVRVTNVLAAQQYSTRIPGLWPTGINVQTQDLTQGTHFTLGAMSDSAYEYLPKTYHLLHGTTAAPQYKTMATTALDAATKHLLFRPITPDNADILVATSGRATPTGTLTRDHSVQHLSCYAGGMYALSAQLLASPSYLAIARRLTSSCLWASSHAPAGIMPESFSMLACASAAPHNDGQNCTFDPAVWPPQQHPGFEKVFDGRYALRPEVIESVWVMYRVTGEEGWRDEAWGLWRSVERGTRGGGAAAGVRDEGELELELEDSMESFWLAETLKYFYLVFSEPELVSLDEWVLSTEAHPFRLRK